MACRRSVGPDRSVGRSTGRLTRTSEPARRGPPTTDTESVLSYYLRTMAMDRRQASFLRFVRDVAVNVLANVLAVAVLYLLSTAAGLVPRSRFATAVSIALIIGTINALGVVATYFVGNRRQFRFATATALLGTAQVVLALSVRSPGIPTILNLFLGVAFMPFGLIYATAFPGRDRRRGVLGLSSRPQAGPGVGAATTPDANENP